MLSKIKNISLEDDAEYAKVTHELVSGIEDGDEDEEIFKRRMGLRNYFKQLRMSLPLVQNAKRLREEARQAAATVEEEHKGTIEDEIGTKEASAIVEAVGGDAAFITNPSKKKKGA